MVISFVDWPEEGFMFKKDFEMCASEGAWACALNWPGVCKRSYECVRVRVRARDLVCVCFCYTLCENVNLCMFCMLVYTTDLYNYVYVRIVCFSQ